MKKSSKKTYIAVYLGSPKSMGKWDKLSAKARHELEAAGIAAWGKWIAKNKKAIVDIGAPLGPTMKIDRKGIKKTKNDLTAYTVVRASSHAAASKLFKNHPHFTIFPGESIEVVECLQIPGM